MWMMLSSGYIQLKICKAFCETPRNDFDFDDEIGLRTGLRHALGINIVAKKMKEISKDTSLSQLYKSWSLKPSYNGHICSFQWTQSCLMQQKTVRRSAQWWSAQTLSREALTLVPHLHNSKTLKVKCDFSQSRTLSFQNFPMQLAPDPPTRLKKFF